MKNHALDSAPAKRAKKKWSREQRWVFWITFGILFLIAVPIAWYHWDEKLGRDAWREYQKEAAARGVSLTVRDQARPRIADEKNFWASPVFDPRRGGISPQWISPGMNARGKPAMDLEAGLKARRKSMEEYRRTPGDAALTDVEFFTKVLMRFDAEWEMVRAAAARPSSQLRTKWTPGRDDEWNFPTSLNGLREHAILRAQLALVERKPAQALDAWRLLRRVSEALESEPHYTAALFQIQFELSAVEVFEQGRRSGLWTDAELRAIEESWANLDLLAVYQRALAGHRQEMTDLLLRIRDWKDGEISSDFWESIMSVEHSVTRFNRWMDELQAELDVANHRFTEGRREYAPLDEYGPFHRRRYLVFESFGDLGMRPESSLLVATRIDQARVVCALERYRLAKGEYPEQLTALVPEFLAAVPNDIFEGEPPRYKRTAAGFELAASPAFWTTPIPPSGYDARLQWDWGKAFGK